MNNKHTGIDLAGIIIIYVTTSVYIIAIAVSGIAWGWLDVGEIIGLVLSVISLIFTILYHKNKVSNYILIGVLGILVSIIGGIFILVGQPKNSNLNIEKNNIPKQNNLDDLDFKIKQLDMLLSKNIITVEEYIEKRRSIIENFK